MTDLRKAAEMALKYFEDAHGLEDTEVEIKEALRQALAEPANSTTDFVEPKASSQPEQKPVAWFIQYEDSHEFVWSKPDGWRVKQALEIQPLYTAPPKREWVGLTDEEVIKCFDSVAFGQVEDDLIINKHVNIFRAIHGIEAKLKEKNT